MGDRDPEKNAERTHEYVRYVLDKQLTQQGEMGNTAYRRILVLAILFAALSYGQSLLPQTAHGSGLIGVVEWIVRAIGLVSVVVLAVSFFAALKLLEIGTTNVPGVAFVESKEDRERALSCQPNELVSIFTEAVVKAIEHNKKPEEDRKRHARRLNCSLKIGFVLTCLFVLAGSTVDSLAHRLPTEKKNVCDENDKKQGDGDESKDTGGQDTDSSKTEPLSIIRGTDESKPKSVTLLTGRLSGE